MIEFSENSFLTKPRPYQIEDVKFILNAPNGNAYNALEMRLGKSKESVDVASILFENSIIDTVIVVCPAIVRSVWDNPERGEIVKHCKSNHATIRYDASFDRETLPQTPDHLLWITISYSFLRARKEKFLKLFRKSNRKIFLIFDESSYLINPKAAQTKAAAELRQLAVRCLMLNGTPTANKGELDLWSQFNILDPTAIDNIGYYHYRARYCLMGGFEGKQVLNILDEKKKALERIANPRHDLDLQQAEMKLEKIQAIEEAIERLNKKIKPWVLRRERKDVMPDLPPEIPPVYLEAQMSTEGYRVYEEMAEEMVAWANSNEYSAAVNGAVKSGRLSQITSGFLGGLEQITSGFLGGLEQIKITDDLTDGTTVEYIVEEEKFKYEAGAPKEVDDSKLKAFLEWYDLNEDLQVTVWCRFRAEMFRLQERLTDIGIPNGMIIGGQKEDERDEILKDFREGKSRVLIVSSSASFGINLSNCYTVVYMSYHPSVLKYQQGKDRFVSAEQKESISYTYILATTPEGKPTIDHLSVKALFNNEDMSKWNTNRWKTEINNL